MKLTTAGESHGKALIAVIEGLPAHLQLNIEKINAALARRQSGFGRGGRQKIEKDKVEILTGVRNGETLGSPVTLCIYNRDFENWASSMSPEACDQAKMQEKSLTLGHQLHALRLTVAVRDQLADGDPQEGHRGEGEASNSRH